MQTQQYLYRIAPTRSAMLTEGLTPEEERVIGDHFAYLLKGVAEGWVMLAGRTLNNDPSSFGIVILRADLEADARARMENDPAVRHGVMRGELFPFHVALAGRIG